MQRKILLATAFFALFASHSYAQTPVLNPVTPLTGTAGPSGSATPVSSGNPLPVTGTFTASLGGFTPSSSGARMTPLTVQITDTSGALPSGAVTVVSNVGTTNPMYCNVNGVAATASDQLIGPNSWFAFTIPATVTTLHCIATGGTTTANGVGGAGLPTGAGGGSSSGGGGGTVTQGPGGASAWLVTGIGGTFPVTGTFWQTTQPVSGTFWQTTQPVSVASGGIASGAVAPGALQAGAGVDGWNATEGAKADAPCTLPASTTACSLIAAVKALGNVGQYPAGAVALTASATGTTAATTATLAGAVGKTTYICSLSVRANATANTNVTDTVTGVITGTLSRALWVPANTAGLGVDEQIYNPCVPASGTNQAIAVVSGAPGTGGVVTVNATGYQQ